MEELLKDILKRNQSYCTEGEVAQYIPALARQSKENLGISVVDIGKDKVFNCGDTEKFFTLQSISKIFTLIMALQDRGANYVFERVGMEPTGDPFNSIIKLETINPSRPLNPMINAGAIAISSMIKGESNEQKIDRVISFLEPILGRKVTVNHEVFNSERETGNRNRAAAYFLKDVGVISKDVEKVLDFYFMHCSLDVTCEDIGYLAAFLANQGRSVKTGEQLVSENVTQIAKSFMVTCGMYNSSGEFAIKVGVPAKSGVGGGVMAVSPNRYGIGVWGPALDEKGNSIAGVKMLEDLSANLNLSIF
ncbi:glutaminase A [Proteinivorax hydrogeniformans]|uniref:Glutaminase n=1 Tax=Proteinivorax hydrogeniformans TaxID=1826727 RepID=A0AAU8HVW4_9FIRM